MVGSNCTVRVAVCVGLRVNGKVAPETVNPAPATAAALTVTAAPPVDERVTVCVVGVFTFTAPKPMLAALTLSVGTDAPSCSANVFATLLALAVRVTVCAVLTVVTVAVKPAEVDPAATVTEAGTVTAELLLARLTVNPPVGAAVFSDTVQLSVPALVIDPLLQVKPLNTGCPVPLRLIAVEVPVEELLVRVRVPETVDAAVGSNCTLSVAV
jgi:hypothetical protein